MPYVFNGPLQFHVGENRSREQKRLGYPAASSEAAALRVHFAEEVQMQVSGAEKNTNVVFLHTTVDDGDHFQPRKLSGLREITGTFSQRIIESLRGRQNQPFRSRRFASSCYDSTGNVRVATPRMKSS